MGEKHEEKGRHSPMTCAGHAPHAACACHARGTPLDPWGETKGALAFSAAFGTAFA